MKENNSYRIGQLITGSLRETLSPAEQLELDTWLAASPDNRALFEKLSSTDEMASGLNSFYSYNEAASLQKVRAAFPELAAPQRAVRFLSGWRWLAAASVVIALGVGIGMYWKGQPAKTTVVATAGDVAPGSYKATLTLANGRQIDLGTAGSNLDEATGANVRKGDSSSLVYGSTATVSSHTLSTPRGGQYRVSLADGTNVWLNAASSITYPTAFNGNERKISITGEAYLEVAHKAAQPFIVALPGGQDIEVLGTSFNINAYADEPAAAATLLTGRIRYRMGDKAVVLQPGQQVLAAAGKPLEVKEINDAGAVTAWKEGKIDLANTSLEALSRQLARWYDIDVKLTARNSRQVFGGVINRNAKLSTVMKALSIYGIRTKLEQNVLIIE